MAQIKVGALGPDPPRDAQHLDPVGFPMIGNEPVNGLPDDLALRGALQISDSPKLFLLLFRKVNLGSDHHLSLLMMYTSQLYIIRVRSQLYQGKLGKQKGVASGK
jgi:hypothetical protein